MSRQLELSRHLEQFPMRPLTNQVFLRLSMHAKLHQRLDSLEERYLHAIERIEEAEIRAYDNEARYAELEKMKRELLAIRFVEREA